MRMASSVIETVGSEYDQTAILAELDRVLRSTNLAEKCYGIVKLPQYFEKYPFPVFITAAFLKLVDAFRNGTNVTRKWILHVAERSENHLDKVISRDELMKRILTVSHSNDPSARALTMRLFAYFARVLADRKQMHHLICTSLDSNDTDELRAAIFAAQRFAKHSAEFGRSVLDKTMQMLLGIDVPPETKLLLVPIFEHFCSDAETSQKAVIFCRDQFLPQCHSSAITGALLTSLTKLAVHAVTVAPLQLVLLLSHVRSRSTSKRVTAMVLDCLHYFAKKTPHLWNSEAIQVLCNSCVTSEGNGSGPLRGLRVLATLTESRVVCLWNSEDLNLMRDLCSRFCFDRSHRVLAASCLIATNMVENLGEGLVRDQLLDTLILSLSTAIPIWPWQLDDNELLFATKGILRCSLQLAKLDNATAQTLARMLINVVGKCCDSSGGAVTECVLALCDADTSVAEWLQRARLETPLDCRLAGYLAIAPKATVQATRAAPVSADQLLAGCSDDWHCFRLGRRALRYGYAHLAEGIFSALQGKVTGEQFSHWIKSLAMLATAENTLTTDSGQSPVDRIAASVYNYHLALICMKAAATSSHPLWFAIQYIQLRQRFLSAVKELHTVWNFAALVPPSVVPTDEASGRNSSRLVSQLSNCEKRFTDIGLGYEALTRRCFDADDGTIDLLALLRAQCFLVQQAIRSITSNRERKSCKVVFSSYNAQTRVLSQHLQWISSGVVSLHADAPGCITERGVEYLLDLVDRICFEIPFFVPRFFFQSLQTSTIKLAVTPKPGDRDNCVRVPSDQRLLVNVEGVVFVSGPNGTVFRRVERVLVGVSAEHGGLDHTTDEKPAASDKNVKLEKTVSLRNDYFAADFMLDFPSSGGVNVRVDLIDADRGIVWDGNAGQQFAVKVLPVAGDQSGSSYRTASVSLHRQRNVDA